MSFHCTRCGAIIQVGDYIDKKWVCIWCITEKDKAKKARPKEYYHRKVTVYDIPCNNKLYEKANVVHEKKLRKQILADYIRVVQGRWEN